jgi:hypothetical protein
MEVQKIDNTLNWLFEKYMEDPSGSWDISKSAEHSFNDVQSIHQVGKYLTQKGFVKNQEFLEDGFMCTITTLGISKISNALSEVKYKILQASIEENKRSVMEILEINPEHFKRGHDFATYLKRIGIIECIFLQNDIFAEPTFYGKEWYEANKPRLIN